MKLYPLLVQSVLSPHEPQTLREFIDEHLANGLVCLTHSLSGAPVLFIKKKDGS